MYLKIAVASFVLLFPGTNLLAQKLSGKKIARYVKHIDALKNRDSLKHYSYPNMSYCGGAVDGYYLNEKLVYIESVHQGELGYTSKTVYLDDTVIHKIIYRDHSPEWKKYEEKYGTEGFIPSKMTYADTLYTITLAKRIKFVKTAGTVVVGKKPDAVLIRQLVMCARRMKFELETERISHSH